ncbi:unnamed protein product [Alternaria alternata]
MVDRSRTRSKRRNRSRYLENSVFSMEHVKRVLEVAEAFEDDMRGGKGYRDAMRQYT